MEAGEGMVAVVRGLKDAGLAVTLVDAGRTYTLLPDTVLNPNVPPEYSSRVAYQYASTPSRRDSGVQATDGRYASTYRMMHCHVTPTSPPDLVTEFPPQKPELCPGHGNFQIGGAGSGETYFQSTKCNSFRGGMYWPDRGSMFTPKPSIQRDSFTSSLRKYPHLSHDRSSEIVERLISFTQAKNAVSKVQRSNVSLTRLMDSDISNQTISLDASYRTNSAKIHRQYEQDATVRPKSALNYRLEESPTRERSRRGPVDQETLDSWRRSAFCKSNDVRYLRDMSRKVRAGLKSSPQQHNIQPEKLNAKERHEPITIDKKIGVESNTNSVNMEIQAAVQMVSREIVTTPIAVPSKRTIAVPLTPSPSQAETKSKILSQCRSEKPIMIPETETSAIKSDKDAKLQTAINDLELTDKKLIQYKGSKSQDEIRRVQNEVLVIQDLHLGACCSKFHRRSYGRLNRSNKFLIKYTRNRERMTEHESKFYKRRCSHVAEDSKEIKRFQSYTRVLHAEVKPFRTCENDVAEILEDWLDLIPLKQEEYSNRRFNKEYMFYDFFECLKHFASNPLESKRKHKLKSDILDRLESVPIETKGNRRVVLNRLADILINKVKHIGCKKCSVSAESSKREINELLGTSTPTYNEGNIMPSTESELKIFISAELMLYLEKTRLNINRHRTKILEDDLLDYFIFHKQELQLGNEKHCKKSVSNILIDYGFSEYQATDFANILLTHLKESFIASTISQTKVKSETFIVLQNVQNTKRSQNYVVNQNKASVDSKTKENKDENLDNYTNELCKQIDDWLSSLKLPILDSVEDGFRKVIINDLAGDIIDRQKYLELNPSSKGSDEAELEHLRYQIFKWTSKLVGEDNFVPKDHAPELMRRINEIPKFLNSHDDDRSNSGHPLNILKVCKRPLLIENSISDFDIKNNRSTLKLTHKPNTEDKSKDERHSLDASISHSSKLINVMTMTNTGTSTIRINGSENRKCNQSTKTPCCINFIKSCKSMKSVEQLEAEYAKFVKDWVQRIPIKVFGPDHGALVERARVELHNSLWKIVSKLNGDPATYYSRFFYEDLLDDAIEDLLNCLPQSPEMKSIRNSLKTEFIEKTVHLNDHIKAHEDASFKNKLVKNVIMNLRQHGIIDNGHDETIKEREDYQIIKLVEEYLLYTRFKNDNKLISNVFKKNLTQEIGDFVTNLKNNHEKELSNIDTVSFKTEIMNALEKVPLPCERTIREEAEDIIMGIEVEQWYNDLPIIQNENSNEKIHRKRELDTLALKIKEFENNSIKGNSNFELRKEISKFLQKSPLKEGERVNINFMVDELINRVKYMRTQDLSPNTKTVIFQAPESYEDFDRNVPLASSYIETPKIDNRLAKSSNPNTQLDSYKSEVSSNLQSHNYFKEPSSYKTFGEALPSSSSYHETDEQWHTLRDSQVQTPKRDITTNTPHYSIPNTSHTYHDKSLSIKEESLNQDYFQNASYQRDFENNQTQTFNADQRKHSSIQIPKGIRPSRGILGIDQAAGPSGYRHGNTENLFESHKTSANLNQMPTASIYTDDRRNGNLSSHRRENSSIINKPDDKNYLSINKFSKGCQSLQNGDENTVENMNRFEKSKHFSVATNTDTDRIPDIGQQIDASTPREDKPSSSQTNKRHPKMDSSEKEGIKRKTSLSETDDEDDEYQCRCIERYWKCRRRPKCLSGDDYPPCVPLLFPYPCFL